MKKQEIKKMTKDEAIKNLEKLIKAEFMEMHQDVIL